MNIQKKMLAGALVAVGAAGAIGWGVVSAAPDSGGERANLAEKIATKFNLNQGEVEAVFEEDKAAHKAEMEQKFEQRLDDAVEQGKITADQKAKILAKHAEMRAQAESDMEAFKDKNKDELRTTMEQRRESIKQWAADNDIPEEYTMMLGMGGFTIGHEGPIGQPGKTPTVMFRGDNASGEVMVNLNQ